MLSLFFSLLNSHIFKTTSLSLHKIRVARSLEKSCFFYRGLTGWWTDYTINFDATKSFTWPFPHIKALLKDQDAFFQAQSSMSSRCIVMYGGVTVSTAMGFPSQTNRSEKASFQGWNGKGLVSFPALGLLPFHCQHLNFRNRPCMIWYLPTSQTLSFWIPIHSFLSPPPCSWSSVSHLQFAVPSSVSTVGFSRFKSHLQPCPFVPAAELTSYSLIPCFFFSPDHLPYPLKVKGPPTHAR